MAIGSGTIAPYNKVIKKLKVSLESYLMISDFYVFP